MIDTIRFKVPQDYELWAELEPTCKKIIIQNNKTSMEEDPRLIGSILIPPYNQPLNILSYGYECIYLEGSLPKLEYGTNVKMLYPSQIPALLKGVHLALEGQYGSFPPIETWEVQRADFCYALKCANGEEAHRILEFLMMHEYPRKSIHIYPNESITFGGRSVTIKFYLKHPEFLKEDYKKLRDNGFSDYADEMLKRSENIVRYEITIRKAKLKDIYGKKYITYKDLLDNSIIYNYLNETLDNLLKNFNRVSIDDENAVSKLISQYGKQKGMDRFYFYKTYHAKEKHIKRFLKKCINPTTVARYLKEISNAGVSFPNNNFPLPFDLSIPNKNVVNLEPAPSALAEEWVHNEAIKETTGSNSDQLGIKGVLK